MDLSASHHENGFWRRMYSGQCISVLLGPPARYREMREWSSRQDDAQLDHCAGGTARHRHHDRRYSLLSSVPRRRRSASDAPADALVVKDTADERAGIPALGRLNYG